MTLSLRHAMKSAAWLCLFCLLGGIARAAAPASWNAANIETQQFVMGIMARVHKDGSALKEEGGKVAVFLGNELRGVADYDNEDGLYFYNLTVAVASTSESGYTFKYYSPSSDSVIDLELPSGYTNLAYNDMGYGGFSTAGFAPFVLTVANEGPDLPVVTITAPDDEATEPSSSGATASDTGKFVFRRTTDDTSAALTIYYTISGTAKKGTDYKSITSPFTIPKGYKTQAIYITPLYDTVLESPETVTLTIVPKDTYTVGEANTATVTINDPNWHEEDEKATVSYTLTPNTAQWKIGNGSWNASGASVEVDAGTYDVSFSSAAGYITPANDSITVTTGQTLNKTITYEAAQASPTVKYTLSPAAAVTAGAQWKLDDGAWNASGAVVTATAGNHTVSFKAVTGYTTPPARPSPWRMETRRRRR